MKSKEDKGNINKTQGTTVRLIPEDFQKLARISIATDNP